MSQQKICATCGTQYPEYSEVERCLICEDERQYIPEQGQLWTTHSILLQTHETKIRPINDRLFELFIAPKFGIGQRALLVLSEHGNILWDCIPMLDEKTVHFIKAKGGVSAIGISHPHYYSNMGTWAKTFDCPIYIHQKDKAYIIDEVDAVSLWSGEELLLWDDLKLLNLGGHFDGGTVLLAPQMSARGTMCCSDILQIAPSKAFVAMMYSYPNNIPLPLREIERIGKRLGKLEFDALYGAFTYQNLTENVKDIVENSIKRYFA